MATTELSPALVDILREHARLKRLHGPDDSNDDFVWHLIAAEELGEAAEAILRNRHTGSHSLRNELVHLGSVVLHWIEDYDRRVAANGSDNH
jgi:hypothetical protein